ncbi:MAG TPA: hypothetical protein VFH22_05445 [Rhodocyclaceae bacterium]|nr:hypothetical protein [Rhodocyclaceae bacterium]
MLIVLHGHLRRFGNRFRLDVKTPAEAVRALCAVVPGFKAHLRQHSAPGYHVLVGKRDVDVEDLAAPIGEKTLRLVPVIAGASSPWVRTVVGAVLVVAGTYFGQTWAVNIGYGMLFSGVSQLIAGHPKAPGPQEEANNQPSFAFDGAVNTIGQGHPVPVLYGRMIVGSAVISAGLAAEAV